MKHAVLVSDDVLATHGPELRALLQPHDLDVISSNFEAHVVAAFLSMDAARSAELGRLTAMLETSPSLRWVHIGWAGVEHPFFTQLAERGVLLTSSTGAAASAVAQHAVGALLALMRGLHRAARAQREHRWEQFSTRDVAGSTVVIVGFGAIGQETARLCNSLGANVIGLRRTATDEPAVWPMSRLDEALQLADAVVLTLPLTSETALLMDARRLSLLRTSAVLVNVGRGGLVDEAALVSALQEQRLAGAALDVTTVEPLDSDSPLWDLPTVLLTPHIAGLTAGTERNATDLFVANLGRFLNGGQLVNRVLTASA